MRWKNRIENCYIITHRADMLASVFDHIFKLDIFRLRSHFLARQIAVETTLQFNRVQNDNHVLKKCIEFNLDTKSPGRIVSNDLFIEFSILIERAVRTSGGDARLKSYLEILKGKRCNEILLVFYFPASFPLSNLHSHAFWQTMTNPNRCSQFFHFDVTIEERRCQAQYPRMFDVVKPFK